jgi:hypothetical protein
VLCSSFHFLSLLTKFGICRLCFTVNAHPAALYLPLSQSHTSRFISWTVFHSIRMYSRYPLSSVAQALHSGPWSAKAAELCRHLPRCAYLTRQGLPRRVCRVLPPLVTAGAASPHRPSLPLLTTAPSSSLICVIQATWPAIKKRHRGGMGIFSSFGNRLTNF